MAIKNAKSMMFISLFGASSGLALSIGNSVIPAWLTSLDFDLTTIGLASLLGMPYLFKFLWAPFFDRYPFLNFTQTRGWLFLTHFSLALFCFGLSFLPRLENYLLLPLLLVFGFFAASLDVVVDGHRTSISDVSTSQKNAIYVFCYRMAMMVSAICLITADYLGWQLAFLGVTFYFLIGALLALSIPEAATLKKSVHPAFRAGWKNFLSRPNAIGILIFILFYKLSIGFALSMNTPFLIRALHFTLTDIGVVQKGFGFFANVSGVFLGGYLINRMALQQALFAFLILEVCAILLFVIMATLPPDYTLMVFAVSFEQFASGLATVAVLTFIMTLVHPDFKNSQVALLTSVTAFGRVLVAPFAGVAVESLGWAGFYGMAVVLTLPALFFFFSGSKWHQNAELQNI